jgi:Alpha-amylase C-terminal
MSIIPRSFPRPREKIVTFACQLRGLCWRIDFLHPVPWRGRDDPGIPQEKQTNESGWGDLWAPPRGYAVYVPE